MSTNDSPQDLASPRRHSSQNAREVDNSELADNEGENLSHFLPTSEHCEPVSNSADNSDSDMGQLRVRDMINLYNLATQKNQELSQAKSMYFGVNKLGSQTNLKQFASQVQDGAEVSANDTNELTSAAHICDTDKSCESISKCSNSDASEKAKSNKGCKCMFLPNECSIKESICSLGSSSDTKHKTCGGFRIMTTDGQTSVRRNSDDDDNVPVEMAYQSKTTIRKTENGVRILIDIFFDKEHSIDIIGSRVETDIPESRILAEFQKQSLSVKTNPSKLNHE